MNRLFKVAIKSKEFQDLAGVLRGVILVQKAYYDRSAYFKEDLTQLTSSF
jgi:hypothetical protein